MNSGNIILIQVHHKKYILNGTYSTSERTNVKESKMRIKTLSTVFKICCEHRGGRLIDVVSATFFRQGGPGGL